MLQARLPAGQVVERCQLSGKLWRGRERCDAGCHPREMTPLGTSIAPGSPLPVSIPGVGSRRGFS